MSAFGSSVERFRGFGLSVVVFCVVLAILVLGKSFIAPFAIAVLLWQLFSALVDDIGRLTISRFRLPRWLARLVAIGLPLLFLYVMSIIVLGQADAIAAAWPRYVARAVSTIAGLADWLG